MHKLTYKHSTHPSTPLAGISLRETSTPVWILPPPHHTYYYVMQDLMSPLTSCKSHIISFREKRKNLAKYDTFSVSLPLTFLPPFNLAFLLMKADKNC
jgi:hypothetical protein